MKTISTLKLFKFLFSQNFSLVNAFLVIHLCLDVVSQKICAHLCAILQVVKGNFSLLASFTTTSLRNEGKIEWPKLCIRDSRGSYCTENLHHISDDEISKKAQISICKPANLTWSSARKYETVRRRKSFAH